MMFMQPENLTQLALRSEANTHVSGYGEDTMLHIPCIFCGGPNFFVFRVCMGMPEEPQHCKYCMRDARAIVTRDGNVTTLDIVQTGGPDQPEWFVPKIRREDSHAG